MNRQPKTAELLPTYAELRCPKCPLWADSDDCPHGGRPAPEPPAVAACEECGVTAAQVPVTWDQGRGEYVCRLCVAWMRGGMDGWLAMLAALGLEPSDVPAPWESDEELDDETLAAMDAWAERQSEQRVRDAGEAA